MKKFFLLVSVFAFTILSCSKTPESKSLDVSNLKKASEAEIEALIAKFIDAKEGDLIEIPAGFYELPTQLILDNVNKVTIKGAGMFETVLSFKTLTSGGEGLKIAGNNIRLEAFTVMDAPGDDIKTQHCDGLIFDKVNTTWTHQDLAKSGTYGIYPVQCKNVVVQNCEVSHSRDAGIYVGQSENIVVRNNYVFENVAGIEIENSDNAEVYDNVAENNTGGILVFNLPGLPKAAGQNCKIYRNTIKKNNHDNFAIAQGGNPVSMIPPGSGVIILSGKNVEVYDNKILDHKTYAVAVASYHITELPIPNHPGWTPFVSDIYIHDNTYEHTFGVPDLTKDLGKLVAAKCFKSEDVLYDGIIEDSRGKAVSKNPMNIFIDEKSPDLRFSRLDIPASGKITEIGVENDIENFKGKLVVKTDVEALKNL